MLVFEFKKLARSSIRTYEGKSGMRRFIDGNYGNHEPLAVMIAMLKPDEQNIINKLYLSLSKPSVKSELCMVHDLDNKYVRKPSAAFPNLKEAIFDTEHRRPPEKAPPGGTTTLAHIAIEFA